MNALDGPLASECIGECIRQASGECITGECVRQASSERITGECIRRASS